MDTDSGRQDAGRKYRVQFTQFSAEVECSRVRRYSE